MKRDGHDIPNDVGFDELRDYFDRGEYDIEVDQTYLIQLELKMVEPVLEACSRRNWWFVSIDKSNPFITCDDPVALNFTNDMRGYHSPGHGLTNTLLYFPLSSEVAVLGSFEKQRPRQFYNPKQVAAANSLSLRSATKQIYAQDKNFKIKVAGERILTADEILEAIREKPDNSTTATPSPDSH